MSDVDDFLKETPGISDQVEKPKDTGVVDIHGKDYRTVALRVKLFREQHSNYTIETSVIAETDEFIRMQTVIRDGVNRVVSTGMAQEAVSTRGINSTSHVENCETSACGRALAFLGFGGSELASADEMVEALEQQGKDEKANYLLQHNLVMRDNLASIMYIKEAFANDDMLAAVEGYAELGHEVEQALWVAPTKGGIWTKEERRLLRSDSFLASMKEYKSAEAV